jgi:hypothetical protein
MAPLILKRDDPSRRRDNDYAVLENGVVVGRIFRYRLRLRTPPALH